MLVSVAGDVCVRCGAGCVCVFFFSRRMHVCGVYVRVQCVQRVCATCVSVCKV